MSKVTYNYVIKGSYTVTMTGASTSTQQHMIDLQVDRTEQDELTTAQDVVLEQFRALARGGDPMGKLAKEVAEVAVAASDALRAVGNLAAEAAKPVG